MKIDKEKCIGCGMCQGICPEVFEMKDGKCQLKEGADLAKNEQCVKDAIQVCPVGAIEKDSE